MVPDPLRPAFVVQLLYAALVILWQLVGVALMATGRPPLGPTTSLAVAAQVFIIAVVYVIAIQRAPLVFLGISIFAAVAAATAIANALTGDPSLWASDTRRYLSVLVNSVGLVGMILAVVGFARWRVPYRRRRERRFGGRSY